MVIEHDHAQKLIFLPRSVFRIPSLSGSKYMYIRFAYIAEHSPRRFLWSCWNSDGCSRWGIYKIEAWIRPWPYTGGVEYIETMGKETRSRKSEGKKDRAQVTGPAMFDAFTRKAETGRRSYDRRQAITTSLSSVDLGYIPICFRHVYLFNGLFLFRSWY